MNQRNHPNMNQNLFTYLPSEIIIDILSRLPVRAIISCKCVCKSWLGLLETHEFVNSHISKAIPGLAVYRSKSKLYKIFEFEDGHDIEHHELHYNPVTKFNLPYHGWISGSTNGLLFLCNLGTKPHSLYICNPITCDYIKLHCPKEFVHFGLQVVTYGFGASKIIGQHKVVRIFQDYVSDPEGHPLLVSPKPEPECHVYTIGTGSWRRIASVVPLVYERHSTGAFLNGNLHWLVDDLKRSQLWISCFDLETELFSTFSPPPPLRGIRRFSEGLFALGDCLCLCDNSSYEEIVIWLMKEYGDEKSWTKEFVICKAPDFDAFDAGYSYEVIYPIKVFKNGDILMALEHDFLFYYSKKDNTTQKIDMFEPHADINAILHTPSFLSLSSFEMENVSSF